ncbi:MAG: winged helix-turn-helix transcriptional regulator [Pseudobacteriovorax sp.]|nr:winged helix-turn-helix transcriptional regulator [Pseudobacteriovorax sp.]
MQWDSLVKDAKNCHSKQSWEAFFLKNEKAIVRSNVSKPLNEIFRLLLADAQCLQYSEHVWNTMLSGCVSAWDLELGLLVANKALAIPNPGIRIKAAEIFLECGQPSQARKISSLTLRLKNINAVDSISARMIVCKSYVEEGRNTMAKRMLKKLEMLVHDIDLPDTVKADMLSNIARSKFFLGNYSDAAEIFVSAHRIFIESRRWEAAASALFNAAASFDNAGVEFQDKALDLVKRCETIASNHSLRGPLSHCFAFHGTHFHNRGVFSKAADNYRNALNLIPESENSFRKLHILSMLTLTFIKSGKFKYAEKYGEQTLELAKRDESERFKIRYVTLKAELYWQRGDVNEAYDLLHEATRPLYANGVNTLEELATLSRYNIKSAQLNIRTDSSVRISKNLRHNNATWLEYVISMCGQHMIKHNFQLVESLSEECIEIASKYRFKFYEAQAHTLLAQSKSIQRIFDEKFEKSLKFLSKISENIEFKLFSIQYYLISATKAYATGDFVGTKRDLKEAQRSLNSPFQKQEILNTWTATIEGHSPKMSFQWQKKFIISSTKMYFSPKVEYLGDSIYLVSKQYRVSLASYPVLHRLMQYLFAHKNQSISAEDLQEKVWKQTTRQQGWQQKIRNSIMRIRSLFPYTIAPIIVYSEGRIHLFTEAIEFPSSPKEPKSEEKILKLLQEGPQSRVQLSNRIMTSQTTTKRILQKLVKERKIRANKVGRIVLYQPISDETSAAN